MSRTSTSISNAWQRVSKRRPCPVCDKPDWCVYSGAPDNPTAVICARVESPKRCGEAGWLHVLRTDGPTWAPWRQTIRRAVRMMEPENGRPDFARLAADSQGAVRPEALERLATALGLTAESLTRLGVGWSAEHHAWTFPMKDAAGNVLGIRLRRPDGRKLSVRGGREGLFLPEGLEPGGRLLVAEGPTDCAALLDLRFSAVGRPSCSGGMALLVELVRRLRPPEVIVVAVSDTPGQRGAESSAAVLVAYCPMVKIITPPAGIKDARQWKQRGATAADVLAAIAAAPVCKLSIKVQPGKAGGEHGR